ncbi:MAG TPA: hypothetical protein ENI62_08430 [Gammaproteobacteria bacterium]|nr:hypothetical protein [Gammaproteobacteria bacterium]
MSEDIKHYTAHWHTSPYPMLVGFGTAFFLPWAFMFNYVYDNGLVAVIFLAIGALLTIYGGLGWASQTIGVIKDEDWSPPAMLMFIGTEIMTIGAVLAGYWTARLGSPVWPPEGTPDIAVSGPVIATLILLVSSITIGLARKKQLQDDAAGFTRLVLLSAAIWIVFMWLTISGWNSLLAQGFEISTNAASTALYGLTGIHFAHVLIGLLLMLTCVPSAMKGKLSYSYARSMTMYVHFVNVLGLWVLLQVYFM